MLEDGASSHDNRWNHELFEQWGIEKMLDHRPRSPDLNAIEHAWDWCRKYIADHRYVAKNQEENEAIWREAWEAIPIEKINEWIENTANVIEKLLPPKETITSMARESVLGLAYMIHLHFATGSSRYVQISQLSTPNEVFPSSKVDHSC